MGQTKVGFVEADNLEIATDTLKDKDLTVVSIEQEAGGGLLAFEIPFFNKIPIKDIVIFSRQFSVLMGAKMPIVTSLKTMIRQTQNKRLQKMIVSIADEVESGTSLSMAMAKYPDAFSNFFVNMIRSGETTGRLEDVMNYLADQMEKDYDLMSKIKGAMTYPIFIIIGLVIVGFIMLTFVVPKLTVVLSESGAALPLPTRMLIFVSGFAKQYVIQIVVTVVLGLAGLMWWIKTPNGKRHWDGFILYLPVFGVMLQRIYLVRFTQSLSTLLAGGVDIPGSLDVCADIVGNAKYREQILATKKEVMDGNSITMVFAKERTIPTMVSQMMAVGEETGRLNDVLEKLTSFYSRELQNLVSTLVSAIEPLIMMVMGAAVGVMVAAIIMPMYSLATQF
ncbi:MAG: type II secretion system F family protein [Patescibacteria group bacterium]